jgi:hypothetical protein
MFLLCCTCADTNAGSMELRLGNFGALARCDHRAYFAARNDTIAITQGRLNGTIRL